VTEDKKLDDVLEGLSIPRGMILDTTVDPPKLITQEEWDAKEDLEPVPEAPKPLTEVPEGIPIKVQGMCPNCDKPRDKKHGMLACRCGGNVINDKWYPKGTNIMDVLKRIQGSKSSRKRNKKYRRRQEVKKRMAEPKPFMPGKKRRKKR